MTTISFERKIVAADSLAAAVARLARPIVSDQRRIRYLASRPCDLSCTGSRAGGLTDCRCQQRCFGSALSKGEDRPVNNEANRAAVLAALESVSIVTVFTAKVPLPVIEIVRPEIYVKGGDYDMVPYRRLQRSISGVGQRGNSFRAQRLHDSPTRTNTREQTIERDQQPRR